MRPAVNLVVALGAALLLNGASALAEGVPVADPKLAAERRGWIDDHARWNAQHMAAARRLEAVAAALRRHDTSFDLHGVELRAHDRKAGAAGHDPLARNHHAQLRAAHAEAAASHRRLMAEVADLERTIAANLHAENFKPGRSRR